MTTATPQAPINLQRITQGAQLPALPQSAIKLLELSQDPENGPAEFAVPIEADPGLAGQILKFVNSSYFGFSREISNIKMAITLVGVRTIKNFALWSAVFSLMPNPKCGPFDLKSLWQDLLRRGLFSRAMARMLGQRDAEEAFSAGLLQDLAVPLLAKELPQQYLHLLNERQRTQRRLSDLERDQFGWDHAEAAGQIARSWKMPESIVELLAGHIGLAGLLDDPRRRPDRAAVALSALLPSNCDSVWTELGQFDDAYNRIRPANGPAAIEILSQIDQEFLEFAPVLKLTAPAKLLVTWYDEGSAQPQGVNLSQEQGNGSLDSAAHA